MATSMTAHDLMEWAAYERVYGPILVHERVDLGFAMLATVIAKVNGSKKAQVKDFLPPWLRNTNGGTIKTPEQLRAAFDAMSKMQGGENPSRRSAR